MRQADRRLGFARRAGHAAAWSLALALGSFTPAAWSDQPLWELGVGLATVRLPHYRGSDQSHVWWLPTPYVAYRGDFFRADRDGARAILFASKRLDLDLSVSAGAPTRSRDNLARVGMPDLAPTLEFGPNLQVKLIDGAGWSVDLRVPVRAAVALQSKPASLGWTATPHVNLDLRGQGWNVGLLTGPVLGSRRYNGYFYDVAPLYASATRPAFRSEGGYAGWQATLAASRRSGDLWFGVFVKADTVAGARFVDSPLVRQRSYVAYGAAVSWVFAKSSQRVADAP